MYDEWMYQTDSFPAQSQQKAPLIVHPQPQTLDKPRTRKRGRSLIQAVAIESKVCQI